MEIELNWNKIPFGIRLIIIGIIAFLIGLWTLIPVCSWLGGTIFAWPMYSTAGVVLVGSVITTIVGAAHFMDNL